MAQVKNSLSAYGESLIKRFELLRLKAYRDTNGHWTIGWGHLLPPDTEETLEWTRNKAEDVFIMDVQWAETGVNSLNVDLSQPQFDALVSLIFNIGSGHFAVSTVKEKILSGAMDSAADAFLLWNDHGNAKGRRLLERAVFLYGTK